MKRLPTVSLLTAGLLLLPGVALAHPSLNPNSGPAGAPIESKIVVPHGCAPGGGMPSDETGASPTVELAVQLQDGVTIEPGEVEGWTTADDGEAVVWSDAGGATTDVIELPVTITFAGESGDGFYLSVYQECESGDAFQWISRPGAESDWPAVYVAVADEVGLTPAPDHEETEEMDHGDDDMAMDDEESHDDMAMDDDAEEMADMATDDGAADADEMAMDDGDDATEMAMDEAADEGEGGSTGLVVGLVALAVLGGGALALRGRGREG